MAERFREAEGTSSYILRGGDDGAARLAILGAATRPTTLQLLQRAGIAPGMRVLDAGCGSGEVTVELARMVGADGHVTGIDADDVLLESARERVRSLAANATLVRADVTRELPAEIAHDHDAAYARFLLSHLRSPWIGISVLELDRMMKRVAKDAPAAALPVNGIGIDDVFVPSPAASAGVKPGDFLVELGGHAVQSVGDFQKWMYVSGIGAKVELGLVRDGQPLRVTVTIEARPPEATTS